MEIVSGQVTGYFRSELGSCESAELPERLEHIFDTDGELISALTVTEPDLTVLVAGLSGDILYCISGGQVEAVGTGKIPENVRETVIQKKSYLGVTSCPELFSKSILMRAEVLYDANGSVCGMVAVASEDLASSSVTSELSKTVVSAAVLVLLAVLIAVYFISERVTSPLRGMCAATQQFANGDFEVRVPVPEHGKDEVAQLAEAFNRMAESLAHLENMRNSFIANVSHDLRTPMTTIIGFIEEIRDGVIPQEEQDHYLEIISNEAHRLSRLVSSLLDISRIQAGDRKFTPKPFDICEMGRVILISFEQQIDEKRLEVGFECDEERMMVLADEDAIYQIFYNICHNAVKFSSVGGALRIRIRADRDHKVLVSVYNDGEGIPEADLPYVFERFYKSDKSRGLDKTGVGLGLFIAKTIIQAHGEKIWVESVAGKNCEFFFTLTRTEVPANGN